MTRPRFVLALLSLLPALAAAQAPAAGPGPLASYPLDGDATDLVTRAPAQAFAVRPAEGRDGRPAGSLRFDGQRSYVNLGDRLAPARFTVSAWIRPDTVGPTQVILSRIHEVPGHLQRNLELRLDPGGFLFLHLPSGAGWESIRGDRAIPAGRWTHVAATYDGERAQLWVDGARDGRPLLGPYQQTRAETFIGARPESASRTPAYHFAGLIADLRIWERALSERELAVLAGRAAEPPREPPRPPPGGPPEALVAHWPLDRGDLSDAAGPGAARAEGKVRPAEDRRGDPAGALAFTGRDWLDAGQAVEPERVTVAAWVRPARVDREMVLVSKLSRAYGPRDRWLELRLERGGRVVLSVPDASGRAPVVRSTHALAPGRWAHVAAAFDGARAVIYVDGQPDGEGALPAFEASRGPLFLGARPDGTGRRARVGTGLEGRLDDVRLYRGALDRREVALLAGRGEPEPRPRPPGRDGWDEDDGAAPALLVRVGQALVRFDAAVARRDAGRLAAAEEGALRALEDAAAALRDDRGAGPLVQRLRGVIRELQALRGRTDAESLDRKRGALASLADTLWNDLAMEVDERPF